jgi:hypothetical protein
MTGSPAKVDVLLLVHRCNHGASNIAWWNQSVVSYFVSQCTEKSSAVGHSEMW